MRAHNEPRYTSAIQDSDTMKEDYFLPHNVQVQLEIKVKSVIWNHEVAIFSFFNYSITF